jgi:hypothetical protein
MELLNALTDRTVIVTLAIVGAAVASAGGLLTAKQAGSTRRAGRLVLWFGYALTFASVALFIVAGFYGQR